MLSYNYDSISTAPSSGDFRRWTSKNKAFGLSISQLKKWSPSHSSEQFMYFQITKWKNVIKFLFTSLILTIFKQFRQHISIKEMRLKMCKSNLFMLFGLLVSCDKKQTIKVMKSCLRYLIRLIDEASEPAKDCGNFMFLVLFYNVFFFSFQRPCSWVLFLKNLRPYL